MNTTITLRGRRIAVQLDQHAVRIMNNSELTGLLSSQTEAATGELITEIKTAYHQLFNTDFIVSDASIAVEIWGHVYADKFAEWVKLISSISLIDDIADKIIYHATLIDIGEHGHDSNRFVWDSLAFFKSAIAELLPGKSG